ncbi:LodA/GoxA family CTQ-dependent oxidase [Bradyrhizobium diazoefficiens]|nr:LodA/GoxA family CTQ-dependent oxidase [Bradyrhizobium diazoefficiens]MBR0776402.1 LodA/GoxA family CTQ-dependent oxidase [Bradyrhizobium diazoefficiens]
MTGPAAADQIVRAVIYPAIGIARVGNSESDYVVGPEVPDPPRLAAGCYRDKTGALKRQAARFRIYGVNAAGEIVRELSGEGTGAKITWHVELANLKAAWYTFQLALDIPEAASAPPTVLRNSTIADRSKLAIRPGPRSVTGANAKPALFDSGAFMDRTVYLGEIFTDAAARLLVLGGRGVSASHDGSAAKDFANNDGWFDDTSDGPVTADVSLDGKLLEVTPAWVVVTPPNYGPRRKSVRTMWDLMRDVAVKSNSLKLPERPSFMQDILPVFQRMAGLQWVNAGFAAGFGWQGVFDLTSPEALSRLSSAAAEHAQERQTISNSFRRFEVDSWSPKPWPWMYGDAMNIPAAQTPRQNASLTDLQLFMLAQWAKGIFEADYDPNHRPPASIEDVPVKQQGDVLTRAALEFCLADAFHPGCEMTWPMRTASMYMAPFRILHAPEGWTPPKPRRTLTSDSVKTPNGPLWQQQAGGITRWMAVPWQTDTASCLGGYDKSYDPYAPTFWPARVPNEVLSQADYQIVVNPKESLDARKAAFARRASWIEPIQNPDYVVQINTMVGEFGKLGVVEELDGPTDTDAFPRVIEVEDQHIMPATVKAAAGAPHVTAAATRTADIVKLNRFPHGLPVQIR